MYIPHKTIRCERCGCEVLAKAPNQVFCRPCSRDAERKRDVARAKLRSKAIQDKPKPPSTGLTIQQTAKMAREAGVTYGAFVAMMEGK